MNSRIILFIIFGFYTFQVSAQALKPFVSGKHLALQVEEIKFPEQISKNLQSGLTTRIQVHLQIRPPGKEMRTMSYMVLSFYDLWDDWYQLDWIKDGRSTHSKKLKKLSDALKALSNFKLTEIVPLEELSTGINEIRMKIVVNPLEEAKIREIRKWVSQNTVSLPGQAPNGNMPNGGGGGLGSLFAQVFNKITDEKGVENWSAEFSSNFKTEGLKREK